MQIGFKEDWVVFELLHFEIRKTLDFIKYLLCNKSTAALARFVQHIDEAMTYKSDRKVWHKINKIKKHHFVKILQLME